jgi:hypothetical protein
MLHDADMPLAGLHLAEQDSSPPASAEEQQSSRESPAGSEDSGRNVDSAVVSSEPQHGSSAARRPPLHLVNARRRQTVGSAGRNIINVYTRDGASST